MAMGIVSDDMLEKELNNVNKPQVKIPVVIKEPEAGRAKGDNNVPAPLRNLISESAQLDGRAEALKFAREFGISPSSVSAYTSEKTSTSASKTDTRITKHVTNIKGRLSKKARVVMREALNHITVEKLEDSSATELATVARSMGSIVKDLEPQQTNENVNAPQIVIYAPQVRNEAHFEYIHVQE